MDEAIDLIKLLRLAADEYPSNAPMGLFDVAADEIERLRKEIKVLEDMADLEAPYQLVERGGWWFVTPDNEANGPYPSRLAAGLAAARR
jgi:hypothetical protein